MSHAWTHPWCKSPCRDEVVRAAEDNRQGPLPTLEEAIAAVTERRPQEPGGGGNVTGLRKERVTLEVTHGESFGVSHWSWVTILRLQSGETVRVVEDQRESHLAAQRGLIDTLTRQRDAAIRERDEAKQHHAWECAKCVALADKVIGLRDRVAELESAVKLAPAANADAVSNPRPISGAGKSAGEETQAASGAAGTEPEAWGVQMTPCSKVWRCSSERQAHKCVDHFGKGTVVPLYAAPVAESATTPQPSPGWLTAKERDSIQHAANLAKASWSYSVAEELENILARSSPPEVVLEDFTPDAVRNLDTKYLAGWDQCMALAKRAIIAAGVTVKEVGK